MILGGAWSGGVHGPRGDAWSRGVVSQHALRHTPPCEQNDKQVPNITLPQTSFADGNKVKKCILQYIHTKNNAS